LAGDTHKAVHDGRLRCFAQTREPAIMPASTPP